MYRLQKRRSKIVTLTRCALPQNIEKLESIKESSKQSSINDNSNLTNSEDHSNIPRPIFKKPKGETLALKSSLLDAVITPQHEEIIRYINDSWNTIVTKDPHDSSSASSSTTSSSTTSSISSSSSSSSSFFSMIDEEPEQQLGDANNNDSISEDNSIENIPADCSAAVLVEPPGPELTNFEPFDLDSFWSQRLFENIMQNL